MVTPSSDFRRKSGLDSPDEDSAQSQDPRDESETIRPQQPVSLDAGPANQTQQTAPTLLPGREGSIVYVSNHQLPQATEDTRGRDGTPVPGAGDAELPIDPALFKDQQGCNDDDEGEDGSNTSLCGGKDRQPPPPVPDSSIAFREASSQPSHREAEHDMQWDQGDAEPANQTPSEAGSRSYSPPAAISSRALLTPAATLEVEEREGSTIYVLNGPHDSLSVAIQPQQPVGLDADPAEYGDYDNNPFPILHSEQPSRGAQQQPGLKRKRQPQRHKQTRKRPRTRGRNAPKATITPEVEDSGQRQDPRDEPENQVPPESQAHHQPGECSSVRSSPTASSGFLNAIQQQPISLNTDQPGDGENSEDDCDIGPGGDDECADYDGGDEYGGGNISLDGDEDRQSALHREAGGDRARPASSTVTIQPGQPEESEESGADTSLAGDEDRQSLPSASDSNISHRQARSREFHAKRRKIQEAEHDIHRDIPSETESGSQSHRQPQQVVENAGRSIRLDPLATTTPPEESSPVPSSPSCFLDATLDAEPDKEDDDDNDDDDAEGNERQKIQQQQDTSEQESTATKVGAKVTGRLQARERKIWENEELQRVAEEEQEDIESQIKEQEEWLDKLEDRIRKLITAQVEGFRELGEMKKKWSYWQKKAEEAVNEAEEERQRLCELEQRLEEIIE
ncbi:hypothetical protein CEP53_003860 [Fusarium sp. AF-6]|nr:hypothetical protein CEP53_003860 [Fusarium sp. AF-6]